MESGGREATTTTTLDRPTLDRGGTRERYATEIRDRGDPGDEDAFVARAMMGRARRGSEETRCIFNVYIDDRRPRGGGASRAVDGTRRGRRMDERTIERPIDRWGDREVEGVSSIVES